MRELVTAKVPFLHQGRDFNGIDCIGALAYALEYTDPIPAYPENPINGELEVELGRILGDPILVFSKYEPLTSLKPLKPLDILAMQYRGPIRHVAMVVPHISIKGQLSVIHTDSALGRVTEHILDIKWLRRIVKVWHP
ncbi:MAG: hypothetical protein PF444_09365 [Bacteroidales bacterium]|nr:hypothetical protein [Bacteroidales bacterium]